MSLAAPPSLPWPVSVGPSLPEQERVGRTEAGETAAAVINCLSHLADRCSHLLDSLTGLALPVSGMGLTT